VRLKKTVTKKRDANYKQEKEGLKQKQQYIYKEWLKRQTIHQKRALKGNQ
jgi:hypothetical protein